MRRSRHLYVTLALVIDTLLITAAWLLAYVVRFHLGLPHAADASTALMPFVKILPIVCVCDLVALGILGLYRPPRTRSVFRLAGQLVRAAAIGWLLTLSALYTYRASDYSRGLLMIFLFLNPVALMGSRWILRTVMRAVHRRGWGVKRAAIIGTGRLAQKVLHGIHADPVVSTHVAYFLTEEDTVRREHVHDVPVLGAAVDMQRIIRKHPVESVFVAIPAGKPAKQEAVLNLLARLPVSVAVVPDFKGVVTLNTSVDEMDGLPVIQLVDTPIQGWNAVVKRVIDLVGAIVLLTLLAVPMLLIAAAVKLTSKGPILFKQTRMGLGGKPFTILKFRSMRVDAEDETGPVWASRKDPRCTRLGRFLRHWSLDELPQLLNVLVGTMSLVGPRPERPTFVEEFVESVPAYMLRHNVKAGITGWAQINGLRGDTSLKKRLQYDLYYLDNYTLGFDLFILIRTLLVGFVNKNAH